MNAEMQEVSLFDVDTNTGKVLSPVNTEPDANLAKSIRGSVSLIKAYQQCPAQAYGRITRQKQSKGVALVNGIAVHEALEKYIKEDADPQKTYLSVLNYEAGRNEVSLNGKAADEARKVGTECVGAGVGILNFKGTTGVPLKDRMDKDLVEKGFSIFRNGRKYVGKMDFIVVTADGERYFIGDWKTGRNAPDKFELDTDLQFSMYAYAAANDETFKTFGKWQEYGVYMYLRGQSREFGSGGRRVAKNVTKQALQYDFPTKRTPEQVEKQFVSTIEPVMSQMEAGVFPRYEGKSCSYCAFFDKAKERCGVEIPTDSLSQPQTQLFDSKVLTESKAAKLKPYSEGPTSDAP
jgi:hypothetical protein